MRKIPFGLSLALLLNPTAMAQSPATHATTLAPVGTLVIQPLPARFVQRFEPLHAALNPSAKAWVDQQAKIEAQRPKPDLDKLRVAIRQRFPHSFASPAPGVSASETSRRVDTVAFLVLTGAAQQTQAQQTYHLQKMQEFNTVSQALSQTLKQLTQQHQAAKGHADDDKPCQTAFCTSLPSRLVALNRASASLPHPLHLQTPSNLTYSQLAALINQMASALDTIGDDSQLANVDLQNVMQKQQQMVQTMSEIEKLMNDTAMSVIRNIGN